MTDTACRCELIDYFRRFEMNCIGKLLLGGLLAASAALSQAAGLLTPTNSQLGTLDIREHHVDVVIDNGYVTTSVEQVFANPNPQDLEAIYSFPVPEKAAVGEFTYWIDGKPVIGEVVEKQQAKTIYEQEKQAGREAALVEKDDYKTFDISVTPVRANSDVRIRLVYIQAAHLDSSVGRYVYPLEEGGVDEVKNAFWSRNDVVKEKFSFNVRLRSGYPVDAVRLPQHPQANIQRVSDRQWNINIANSGQSTTDEAPTDITSQAATEQAITQPAQSHVAQLDKDIVLYWRLADNLPGAMDMVTYREANQNHGTFMLTLTPGDDLSKIQQGNDWIFVLDISGSMQGKYTSLVEGVREGLSKLRNTDRFKVVLFNNNAIDFTQGFLPVTPANIQPVLDRLQNHSPGGGTNLYAGLRNGITGLDADRSSAVILVTDGVANVGTTEKKAFIKLLKKNDVRLFTFVMGNSANRPLLEEMTTVSNGFAQSISNADDITGQIALASQKMTHQALRNIQVDIKGVKTKDITPAKISSLYRGEQLIILGHYYGNQTINNADITIKGQTGADTVMYKANMQFPVSDTTHPELERLWAYGYIENLQSQLDYYGQDGEQGATKDTEQAITDVAVKYGLVTDYTSMIVVREEVLQQLGINANNKQRVEKEQQARKLREQQATAQPSSTQAAPQYNQQQTVSNKPRPSIGNGGSGGGGSMPLWFAVFMLALLGFTRLKKD